LTLGIKVMGVYLH